MPVKLDMIRAFLLKKGANSTLNAFVKISHSKRLALKVFWTLMFILLMSICSFILIMSIMNYLAYDIVTTIRIRTEIPAKMPKIILCNSNSFTTNTSISWASYLYSLYGIKTINNYLEFTYNQIEYPRILNNKGNILVPRTMAMSATVDPKLSDSFRQSLGMSIKDVLISCTFNLIECTADDFTWIYDPYYGNCFEFNYTGRNQISQSGKFNGLNVELFAGMPNDVNQLAQNNGFHIFIVNETVKINTFSDGVNVATGKETNIFVENLRVLA